MSSLLLYLFCSVHCCFLTSHSLLSHFMSALPFISSDFQITLCCQWVIFLEHILKQYSQFKLRKSDNKLISRIHRLLWNTLKWSWVIESESWIWQCPHLTQFMLFLNLYNPRFYRPLEIKMNPNLLKWSCKSPSSTLLSASQH